MDPNHEIRFERVPIDGEDPSIALPFDRERPLSEVAPSVAR